MTTPVTIKGTLTTPDGKVGELNTTVFLRSATKFGCSVTPYPNTGRTYEQELAAHDADCGHPRRVTRVFDGGLPLTWGIPSAANGSRSPVTTGWENVETILSMKPDMEAAAAGELDDWLSSFIDTIPHTGTKRRLVIQHEPENAVKGGKFTWSQYVEGLINFGKVVKAEAHPDVEFGPIFMSKFTLAKAQPYHLGYFIDAVVAAADDLEPLVDFIGFDPYHEASKSGDTTNLDPSYYFDDCVNWQRLHFPNAKFVIGETGIIAPSATRVQWLEAVADYAEEENFAAVCYFDASITNPWYLRRDAQGNVDTASALAWGEIYDR